MRTSDIHIARFALSVAVQCAVLCFWQVPAYCKTAMMLAGINLYGVSHHYLENGEPRDKFSEFNPGVGARLTWVTKHGNWTTLEAGKYRDSFRRTAKYVAAGIQMKLWSELRLGAHFGLYQSESTKQKDLMPIIIPVISYTWRHCTMNGVFLPKLQDVNPWNTLGAYLSLSLPVLHTH